jgi:hypothetical protein
VNGGLGTGFGLFMWICRSKDEMCMFAWRLWDRLWAVKVSFMHEVRIMAYCSAYRASIRSGNGYIRL